MQEKGDRGNHPDVWWPYELLTTASREVVLVKYSTLLVRTHEPQFPSKSYSIKHISIINRVNNMHDLCKSITSKSKNDIIFVLMIPPNNFLFLLCRICSDVSAICLKQVFFKPHDQNNMRRITYFKCRPVQFAWCNATFVNCHLWNALTRLRLKSVCIYWKASFKVHYMIHVCYWQYTWLKKLCIFYQSTLKWRWYWKRRAL